MRLTSPFLLALSLLTFSEAHVIRSSPASISRRDGQPDSQTIAAWEATGSCFSYFDLADPERASRPCPKYCKDVQGKEGPTGCRGPAETQDEIDPSIIWKDDDGNEYTPGVCICDGIAEVAEVFMDIVVEALEKLDELICAVFLESFNLILELGLLVVPGGFEAKAAGEAVRAGVQGAKSILENGGDASDFFGGWVGPACGMPEWDFDITMVFGVVKDAPDSMGTSVGCLRKKKGDCKKLDPKPDPPPKEKEKEREKPDDKKTTTTEAPTTTKDPSATSGITTSTTTADACQATRAGKGGSGTGKGDSGTGKKGSSLGSFPIIENYGEFYKYCSTPLGGPPAEIGKRHVEHNKLQARAKPANFEEVKMGQEDDTERAGKGLWSPGFGTCVGIIVSGHRGTRRGTPWTSFLLHLSLGEGEDDIKTQWDPFEKKVRQKGWDTMEAWIYTPDTNRNHPDLAPYINDLKKMLNSLDATYKILEESLQRLVGCGGRVIRRTHPFSQVGEMQVGLDGSVKFNPNGGYTPDVELTDTRIG